MSEGRFKIEKSGMGRPKGSERKTVNEGDTFWDNDGRSIVVEVKRIPGLGLCVRGRIVNGDKTGIYEGRLQDFFNNWNALPGVRP